MVYTYDSHYKINIKFFKKLYTYSLTLSCPKPEFSTKLCAVHMENIKRVKIEVFSILHVCSSLLWEPCKYTFKEEYKVLLHARNKLVSKDILTPDTFSHASITSSRSDKLLQIFPMPLKLTSNTVIHLQHFHEDKRKPLPLIFFHFKTIMVT